MTSIQISVDGVMAETGDSIEFSEMEIQPGIEQLTFVVANQQLSMRDQRGVEVLKQPFKADAATSLEMINDGRSLEIIQVRTEAVRQPFIIDNSQPDDVWVVDQDGKSYASQTVAVKDGVLRFGKTELPVSDLATIQFGQHSFTNPPSSSAAVVLWADGSRMAVDAFKSRHFKLSISSDRIADRASVEVSSPQAVFIADVPSPYAAGSKKRWTDNERLRIGAVAYFGRFSWGDSQQPLRWTFPGFNEPVVLKLNRKLVLTDLKQAAFPDLSGLDRLVLNNGTILPCRVMGIGEDGVRIESPFCEVKTIPTDQYRACFFVTYVESSQTQPLTQESVQRMLTIPRFTRDLEPTHVLMTVTGDLLRGTLVSVGKKFVMFDSRGEPLRVERQRVERQRVGVIVRFQSSLTATGKDITEGNTKGASSPKNVNVITINYGNDFVIIGELRASEPQLEINVPQLGFCQIPRQGIQSVQVNANRKPLSELYRCMDWNPVASIDPRWREPELEDQDATKLKGQVAPDFELTTLDGEKFCLSDHLGKVVVLDFWATWCRPCVLGMPDNLKVVRAYSEGEVVFAAINFTETSSTLKDFNKTMRWDARILLDPSADVASKYNVTALPHLVVIDPQGNVAEVKVGHHADTFRKSSLDNQICITK